MSEYVATYSDILLSERLARTYAKLLTTRPVLEETLRELHLEGVLSVDELKERISVQPVRDTTLIQLNVEDTDPARAIALANKIPEVFARHHEKVQLARFEDSKRTLEEQLKRLEEDIRRAQAQLASLKASDEADDADIMRLETQITTLQASYANLLKQYEEIRLAEANALDTIIVSEPATEAKRVRPRPLLNTLLAAIVGLMIGLGAVFLLEYLDDTVKTPDEVEQKYHVPVLGGITDVATLSDSDTSALVVHNKPKEPVSEAFRALRTNLQFASVDTPLHSFVITSPEPEEGKSFIAANLAIALAQMEQRVILVDADLRKPKLDKYFGKPNNVGLATLFLDKPGEEAQHLDSVIQDTGIPGLQLILTGPTPPNPAELLGSQRMANIIKALQERADIVIFDTPPILVATDAVLLSKATNGALLVVRVGETHHPALRFALQELQRVNARILGVVLNGLPVKRGNYYYRYYPYNYGYYHRDGKEEAHSKKRKKGLLRLFS